MTWNSCNNRVRFVLYQRQDQSLSCYIQINSYFFFLFLFAFKEKFRNSTILTEDLSNWDWNLSLFPFLSSCLNINQMKMKSVRKKNFLVLFCSIVVRPIRWRWNVETNFARVRPSLLVSTVDKFSVSTISSFINVVRCKFVVPLMKNFSFLTKNCARWTLNVVRDTFRNFVLRRTSFVFNYARLINNWSKIWIRSNKNTFKFWKRSVFSFSSNLFVLGTKFIGKFSTN